MNREYKDWESKTRNTKIGETFTHNKEKYLVKEVTNVEEGCRSCDVKSSYCNYSICDRVNREDRKDVFFVREVKNEKV